jgi:hypothetical protein
VRGIYLLFPKKYYKGQYNIKRNPKYKARTKGFPNMILGHFCQFWLYSTEFNQWLWFNLLKD